MGQHAFFLGHAKAEHKGDFHALGHAQQLRRGFVIKGLDDAAAPAPAGGRQLDGLAGDARIVAEQFLAAFGHEHGDEGRGPLAGMRAAPVFERAGPAGQAEQFLAGFARPHQNETQFLGIASRRGHARAIRQPVQIGHAQGLVLFKTAAGAGRLHQFFEVHMPYSLVLAARCAA